METHKIKGGFLKKYFPNLDSETAIEVEWPSDMKELNQLARDGKITIQGVDFEINAATICNDAWRGFSLQHQGGGANLTEEEKAERKLDRKAEREAIKEMKMDETLKARLDAAIKAKKEALKAQAK